MKDQRAIGPKRLRSEAIETLKQNLEKTDGLEDPEFPGWNPQLAVLRALAIVQDFLEPLGIESAAQRRLEIALFDLFDGLDLAGRLPKSSEQEGIILAAKTVSNFVSATRGWEGPALSSLNRELENVTLGHRSALLTPSKKGGRKHTRRTNVAQATAAAAISLHMKATGVGEKDAAKHVARALKKGGVDNIDATNILSWRDKFMRGHSGPGSDWYQKFLELEVESDPTIRARIALGWAVWFGRFFPASREV